MTHQLEEGLLTTPEVVTLLSLKKIHLIDARICSNSFNNVLLGCLVIEKLSLKNCFLTGYFRVSNITVKYLVVEKCCYGILSISTVSLISLELNSSNHDNTRLANLSSLIYARVNYQYLLFGSMGDLSVVQHLDLCSRVLKVCMHLILMVLSFCFYEKKYNLNISRLLAVKICLCFLFFM